MSEGKNTTRRKLRLSRRTFIVVILSVCAAALVTEIVLLIHSFTKKKSSSKASEGENYDGYIWLLVEETDSEYGTCKYSYDDLGRCIRVEYNGFLNQNPSLTFCEIADIEYIYRDGESLTVISSPNKKYFLNQRNKEYYNSSGIMKYDECYEQVFSEETNEYLEEYRMTNEHFYDGDGRVIHKLSYDGRGEVFNEIVYEYDRYGHTISMMVIWKKGERVNATELSGKCDSEGRVIEIRNSDDEIWERIEYFEEGWKESLYHNGESNPYREVWYNAKGEMIRSLSGIEEFLREETEAGYRTIKKMGTIATTTEEYDKRGLLIARDYEYLDSDRQPAMTSKRMTYDEDGRLIREERTSADGILEIIQAKYIFDSYGNLTAEIWSGTDMNKKKTYRYVPIKLPEEQLKERAKFYYGTGIYDRLTARGLYN